MMRVTRLTPSALAALTVLAINSVAFAQPPFGGDRGGMLRRIPIFAALDRNDDGKLSEREIQNAAAAAATLDKNKDGRLNSQELMPSFAGAGRGPTRGRPSFGGPRSPRVGGAQSPGRARGGGRGPSVDRAPAVGEPLPDVVLYDAEGNPINLTDLKGSYSVLVFGCLT